jgi:hypothetical protein
MRVVCWGNSVNGLTNVSPGLINVRAIAAGYNHCLALLSNGTVVAWGDNSAGQTNLPGNLTNIIAIAAGRYHSIALRSNGTVTAWGTVNNSGQLNIPAGLTGVRAIAAGGDHSLALRTNGAVVAWGENSNGQTNVPSGLTNVAFIAAGDTHSIASRSNGTVIAWGDNASGQTNTPVNVTNVALLAAGYHHNLAVRSNGTVAAWQLNVYGEGVVPPGVSNLIAISAGYFLSVGVRSNGTVVAWGQDFSGETDVPPGLTNVVAVSVSAGGEHVMAMTPSPICNPALPDNFECRQPLVGSNVIVTGSNVGASHEAGEPQHSSVNASNSIWYTWMAPASGGLIFKSEAPLFSGYFKPIVAVYTGSVLSNLVKQASNTTAANTSGGDPVARAALTVTANQVYQIVVDGVDQGPLTNTLTFSAPPANDMYSNAIPIFGLFASNSGSFLGASREFNEPSHSMTNLGQTLWWRWTAPTNLPNPVSLRLLADAVNFPPGVGVYTGNVVTNLSPLALVRKTNGMTSDVIFSGVPGTTYQIALAGTASDSGSASPLIGSFHLRLNTRTLALTVTNLSTSTNGSGAVMFQADALVQNLGNATSAQLRLLVSAISGQSTVRALSVPPPSTVTNLVTTNLPSALSPGQSMLIHFTGVAPAPNPSDASSPIAYGVYAELQEQSVPGKWFSMDQTLVTYDKWPGIGDIFGPGGGVIRLDPGYGSGTSFIPLTNVSVIGATGLREGSATNYFGQAAYSDATTVNFTNTTWAASMFTIASNGVFSTGRVTSNTIVTLLAVYSVGGVTHYASTNVTVVNLPGPALTNLFLSGNAGVVFTVVGIPGRSNVVEAATNLSPPVFWIPLVTNAPANGSFSFTNFSRTNMPMRFYRAREK